MALLPISRSPLLSKISCKVRLIFVSREISRPPIEAQKIVQHRECSAGGVGWTRRPLASIRNNPALRLSRTVGEGRRVVGFPVDCLADADRPDAREVRQVSCAGALIVDHVVRLVRTS